MIRYVDGSNVNEAMDLCFKSFIRKNPQCRYPFDVDKGCYGMFQCDRREKAIATGTGVIPYVYSLEVYHNKMVKDDSQYVVENGRIHEHSIHHLEKEWFTIAGFPTTPDFPPVDIRRFRGMAFARFRERYGLIRSDGLNRLARYISEKTYTQCSERVEQG